MGLPYIVRLGAIFGVLAMLLGACAETQLASHVAKSVARPDGPEPSSFRVGKPYEIKGVWYYPSPSLDYNETGIASWYGPGFQGNPTSNGEIFDQNRVSAAHKTLPLPSIVRVTNLDNGRSIVVRVNDRGPFVRGRIIDLSRRAAQLLDFEKKGVAPVRVEVLQTESKLVASAARQGRRMTVAQALADSSPPPEPAPAGSIGREPLTRTAGGASTVTAAPSAPRERTGGEDHVETGPINPHAIYVQAGAFTVRENAEKLQTRLSPIAPVALSPVTVDGRQYFRVRLGPLASVEEADTVLAQVVEESGDGRIVVE